MKLVNLVQLILWQRLKALATHEQNSHLIKLFPRSDITSLLQKLLEIFPKLDPVLLRVELVEEVFVNGLRFGRVQHVKGDPVFRGVAIKEIGFHPSRVLWVLHEPSIKVLMFPYPLLDKQPVPGLGMAP